MATILLAVDGTPLADDAARWAVALLGLEHHWELVRVVSPHGPAPDALGRFDPPTLDDRQLHDARLAAEQATLDLAEALGVTGEVRIETGDAGPTVCAVATSLGADLVVVGRHGRGPIGRAVLGSVSGHVVAHAPCPVLVHRRP